MKSLTCTLLLRALFCSSGADLWAESIPTRILDLEHAMESDLADHSANQHFDALLNTWQGLVNQVRFRPEILNAEIASTQQRLKVNIEKIAGKDEFELLVAYLNRLEELQLRLGLRLIEPISSPAKPIFLDTPQPRSRRLPLEKGENEREIEAAAEVYRLPPPRPRMNCYSYGGTTAAVYRTLRPLEVGDLVLSPDGLLAEVAKVKENTVILRSRLLPEGEYDPNDFVKEADRPFDRIWVGSFVPDGVGGWGVVRRLWEDGRLEISGRRFFATPYHISEIDLSTVRPPRPKVVPWNQRVRSFLRQFLGTCERALSGNVMAPKR